MTYTQFVSTMNHLYRNQGPEYLIDTADTWFTADFTGYCIGLLEYCCEKTGNRLPEKYKQYRDFVEDDYVLTESMQVMCDMMGKSYLRNYVVRSIPEFIKHKVCITEVGNAV